MNVAARARQINQKVDLIGVPTDIGAGARGGSMGPEALRVAGITEAISELGYDVRDLGNVTGPQNPLRGPVKGYRHLAEIKYWLEGARDAVYQSLSAGSLPIMMGGDHSLAIGSISAVAKYCHEQGKELIVLWLDAHADFNTGETTPSGNIHGMPVAVLTGLGPKELLDIGHANPIVDSSRFVQVGIRSVDKRENDLISKTGVKIFDMRRVDELGMRTVMERVISGIPLENAHLHVSFDVDFLDPAIAPGVATTVPGGPNYREAQLCMEMIYDTGLMSSLDIVELNPAFDDRNRTASLAVELVESLFGNQILTRNLERERERHFLRRLF